MPNINITIGKRTFELVCGEGQENHLRQLASQVSKRLEELSHSMGTHNDSLLLVMTTLMLQDELNELKSVREKDKHQASDVSQEETDAAMVETITAISEYVEAMAKRIENT